MKKSNLSKIILLILLAIAGFYFGVVSGSQKEFVIVATNDVHASIDNMPQLMTLVEQLRAENDNVIVMDAGDRNTGNPYVDRVEPQGKPLIDLMNMVGYDYLAIGNHEFDYQQPGLEIWLKGSEAQALCANADFSANPALDSLISPYEIIEMNGVRIAILSLVQLNSMGIPSAMPAYMEGISFTDGIETSHEYKFLRDSADLVIGLTHLGYTTDSLMVLENTMFDLVVGGHSHTYIPNGVEINGTLVTQSGERLDNVSISRIKMRAGKVVSVTNEVVSLTGIEGDEKAAAFVDSIQSNSPLNKSIGKLDGKLDEIGLINLFGDAMRAATGADFAVHNSGGVRIDSLSAGDVSAVEVYKMEPFNNYIVTQKMSLAMMEQMILNTFNNEGSDEAQRVDLYPSGMKYDVMVDANNKATSVKFYDMNGRALANKTYTMAISNYVSSAYNYDYVENTQSTDGTLLAPAICDAITRAGVYKADNELRAKTVKVN